MRKQAHTLVPQQSFLLAAFVAMATLAGVTLAFGRPPQAPAPPAQTAAQRFKNIQVLKDIPADELIPSMQFITSALGVDCGFCHVEGAFDKDDKKTKKTARQMMEMMFAINKNNFDGERDVTCNTCHRGSPHPQAIPAILAEGPKAESDANHEHEMETPAQMSSGEPILARYIQALGGENALSQVSSRVERGNVLLPGGPPLPITIYTKAHDQRVSVVQTPKGESITAYNGQTGWLSFPVGPPRHMSPLDQQAAKLDAEAFYPDRLAKQFDELKLQPNPETVDGRQTDLVLGLAKGEPPVKLYFDKQSGLLVRMVHYINTPLGLNPIQIDYTDYRDVGGLKTPYRWTLGRPSGSFTIQLDKVEQNVPIDSARFVEPHAVPPNGAGHSAH